MKKLFLSACAVLACLGLRAQVVVLNDNMWATRLSEIHATVVDSLTNEPVPYASFYVIPDKDTTITNFTLTDPEGKAKLEDVPVGRYTLHVEMMGYRPVVRSRYFRERREDLGTVRLVVDEHFLDAAVVTDKGNPVIVKQDTLEYNASSFHVGSNAMLKDLLRKMPGIEVSDDGTVKVNGEAVDKITVGGKTFFFNDKSAALNNLPAAVVDKIRVVDRESESTRATGVEDGSKEKVMDVVLKKEYEKGWFGNLTAKGGATLLPEGGENDLKDDRGALYAANALVSAYSEKDQVTLIGNLQNTGSDGVVVMVSEDGTRTSMGGGLTDFGQLGVNATTSRIKDVETAVMGNYKYNDTRNADRATRTTWLPDGDLLSVTDNASRTIGNDFSSSLEMKKESGKVWFHFRPGFQFSDSDTWSEGHSVTSREGTLVNRSDQSAWRKNRQRNSNLRGDVIFRNLWGKEGRNINVGYRGGMDLSGGGSDESSLTTFPDDEQRRQLFYDNDSRQYSGAGSIRFTEPVGKFTFSVMGELDAAWRTALRDASDAAGHNEYYSSESRTRQLQNFYDATVQYKWGKNGWATLGIRVDGLLDENYTRSFGIADTTGVGDWTWYVLPTLRIRHQQGSSNFSAAISGSTRPPGRGQMLPVLNVSNPTRITLGNIWLKPYGNSNFNLSWYRNDPKTFSMVMVYLYGAVNRNPVSSAQWYDGAGVLYQVPVNVRTPGLTGGLSLNFSKPFGSGRHWTLSNYLSGSYARNVSYLATGNVPVPDTEKVDYTSFMQDFWGDDASGERFYSGASGFSESATRSGSCSLYSGLAYSQDPLSVSLALSGSTSLARYSLNTSFNRQTWRESVGLSGDYRTPHQFELKTSLSYGLYQGYADGYNDPELMWNAEVSRNIGAFNLSLTVRDILNQTRSREHSMTVNYEEDTSRIVSGRYFLFGGKWNFGKMNAAHSQRASRAAMDMAF